ncbi:MAG TPA: ferredoxin [Lachnospiraceae bacterium]|nr:ferredoxin [Lachnospiraceae bacterium]
MAVSDIKKLGTKVSWKDLTEGMMIAGAGVSREFLTGEWSSVKPQFDERKCTQCLLCTPVCPDSCIPVVDKKRGAFDYDHCKGCGICVKACPAGAITMEGVE